MYLKKNVIWKITSYSINFFFIFFAKVDMLDKNACYYTISHNIQSCLSILGHWIRLTSLLCVFVCVQFVYNCSPCPLYHQSSHDMCCTTDQSYHTCLCHRDALLITPRSYNDFHLLNTKTGSKSHQRICANW